MINQINKGGARAALEAAGLRSSLDNAEVIPTDDADQRNWPRKLASKLMGGIRDSALETKGRLKEGNREQRAAMFTGAAAGRFGGLLIGGVPGAFLGGGLGSSVGWLAKRVADEKVLKKRADPTSTESERRGYVKPQDRLNE